MNSNLLNVHSKEQTLLSQSAMNTFRTIQSLGLILLVTSFVACQKPSGRGPETSPDAPVTQPALGAPAVEGGSSGGGGYVSENSALLLKQSSATLAAMIRRATPVIFADLPSGWTAERLASIVENIRSTPDKDIRRDGQDVMFNYVSDGGTEYIEALKPFFHVYGAVPIKMQTPEQMTDLKNDVMLKLLHEAAHLMIKKDGDVAKFETDAENFAYDKILEMDLDVYSCVSEERAENGKPFETGVSIRRSSGEAWKITGPNFSLTAPALGGTSFEPGQTRRFLKSKFQIGSLNRNIDKAIPSLPVSYKRTNADIGDAKVSDVENFNVLTFNFNKFETGGIDTVQIEFSQDEKTGYVAAASSNVPIHDAAGKLIGQKAVPIKCQWRSDAFLTVKAK